MRPLILVALACAAGPALALDAPTAGKLDQRMLTTPYIPGQVYPLHMGIAASVTLAPTDSKIETFGTDPTTLRDIVSGTVVYFYSGGQEVTPRPIFIHAMRPDGTQRTYTLMVDAKPAGQADLSLTFSYPPEVSPAAIARWKQSQADKAQAAARAAFDAASGADDSNLRYVLRGDTAADWDLLPTREVSDNGTDTHFHFPGNMRVPVIYAVNPDGKEAVVDATFNSQTGVATVHQLAHAFRLRDGDALLAVYNKAFDPIGVRSATGTISSDVERIPR